MSLEQDLLNKLTNDVDSLFQAIRCKKHGKDFRPKKCKFCNAILKLKTNSDSLKDKTL